MLLLLVWLWVLLVLVVVVVVAVVVGCCGGVRGRGVVVDEPHGHCVDCV